MGSTQIEKGNLVKAVIATSNQSVEGLKKNLESQGDMISTMVRDTRQNIETVVGRTGQSIEELFRQTSDRLEVQLTNLDEELQKELSKSLGSLGSQLSSLSAKFVDDYTPLTQKLKQVVSMAKGV